MEDGIEQHMSMLLKHTTIDNTPITKDTIQTSNDNRKIIKCPVVVEKEKEHQH